MRKIIGISGFINSGKDTVADYLVNYHGFRRESFAAHLKDVVSVIFGWDRVMLEGRTSSSRIWREQVDSWWSEKLGQTDITPRSVLQILGTDVLRQNFHNEIWIHSLAKKILSNTDHIVITDVRFNNEAQMIRECDGILCAIQREPSPYWYHFVHEALRNDVKSPTYHNDLTNLMRVKFPQVHESEWSWLNIDHDIVVKNNGSIEDLYVQIKNLVVNYQESSV